MNESKLGSGLSAARAKIIYGQHGDQSFGVEDCFVFEHRIDRLDQLDGDDGVGFEFITVHLGL